MSKKWIIQADQKLAFGEFNFDYKNNIQIFKVGTGKAQIEFYRLRRLIHKIMRFLKSQKAELHSHNLEQFTAVSADFIEIAFREANYNFDIFKTKKDKLASLPFNESNKFTSIISGNINLAKTLINSPPNIITPEYLANYASQMAQEIPELKVTILNKEECQKLGLGAFLAVAQGSKQKPYLIEMNYKGKPSTKEIIGLLGKGLTFDTGGLCLKPNNYMNGMHSDMAGAATVMAIMKSASQLKLPINLTGLVLACENGFSESSYRPDDILTAYNGKTIEVIDTDAEGRLTLADGLAYLSERKEIKTIIDYATLTGSCSSALGEVAAGAFTNSSDLLQKFKLSSSMVGEPVWELPLFEEYKEDLESSIADLIQCSGRPDASIAALFLKEFVKEPIEWLHLDIAGTAFLDKENEFFDKGATGRHIWATIHFLKNL